jgi:hypothetical protein
MRQSSTQPAAGAFLRGLSRDALNPRETSPRTRVTSLPTSVRDGRGQLVAELVEHADEGILRAPAATGDRRARCLILMDQLREDLEQTVADVDLVGIRLLILKDTCHVEPLQFTGGIGSAQIEQTAVPAAKRKKATYQINHHIKTKKGTYQINRHVTPASVGDLFGMIPFFCPCENKQRVDRALVTRAGRLTVRGSGRMLIATTERGAP